MKTFRRIKKKRKKTQIANRRYLAGIHRDCCTERNGKQKDPMEKDQLKHKAQKRKVGIS